MDESNNTLEYVSGRLLEEMWSQKIAENAEGKEATVTAAVLRRSTDKTQIRCYMCNKKMNIARYCRIKIMEDQEHIESDQEEETRIRAAVVMKKKDGI